MKPRIEVFKTNVTDKDLANSIIERLKQCFPDCMINFDLHDCDKILRIEGSSFNNSIIKNRVEESGFYCETL